jgi:hypothetical protein
MKRISLLLTGLVLFCGWVAAQDAKISFNETEHDFGTIGEKDGNASTNFVLTNTGSDPVVISNVQASCGCTRPVWTKEPIEQSKTGNISVTYNPLGRIGPFDKTITIFLAGQTSPVYLKIKGTVVQSVKKEPTPQEIYPVAMGNFLLKTKDLKYGRIGVGESKTIKLEVFNNSDKPMTQKALRLPKYMAATFTPAIIPAKTAGAIEVNMHVQEANLYGNLSGNIALLINGVQQSFSYSATVLDDFSVWTATKKADAGKINVSASEINFGNFTSGSMRTLKISNPGKSPLNIRNIQSSNPSVTVTKTHFAINPGEISEVKVNADPKNIQSKLQSTLSIITDDPNMPVYEVTVTGNNKKS